MGLKKKLQAARLTAEERRSASQGATRHAVNGMMAGMMAGSLAGLAVFPFAPITAPAGMVAGAILGLAAGASAGAIEGVRRERQFDRYAANYQPDDENAVVLNGQVVGSHNGNGLYDSGRFPGEGRVVGEAPDDIDPEADRPISDTKPSATARRTSSFTSGSTSASAATSVRLNHARPAYTTTTTSTTTSTTSITVSSAAAGGQQANNRGRGGEAETEPLMTDKQRRRATKQLEKELAREQKLARKEEKKQRKKARKEEQAERKLKKQTTDHINDNNINDSGKTTNQKSVLM
ncbi:uncharacterized protein ACA1_148660 [Acanthamoeba castellanii str. Neff]|uniref:Glycine zipper domain-containing protein n=1 Tax=Acanthamoeba castellanii (strain ATCC 30010 / Neff) TaxID=1257118 RepID=L8HB39_ACACF|nr:uncharacterized protein ACA1_148660 [Acanthamoeba castellanii str. Neff]ELR22729.1 hypothetical protein ACA1_148660 [Acanthamoeba castellanii str. Neff]